MEQLYQVGSHGMTALRLSPSLLTTPTKLEPTISREHTHLRTDLRPSSLS